MSKLQIPNAISLFPMSKKKQLLADYKKIVLKLHNLVSTSDISNLEKKELTVWLNCVFNIIDLENEKINYSKIKSEKEKRGDGSI